MRRFLLPVAIFFAALLIFGWMSQRPPVPEFTPLGEEVKLDFEVNGIEGRHLELGLARGAKGALFMQFNVGTEKGRPVVSLNGASARSEMKKMKRGQKLPEWSFLRGQNNKTVLNFAFKNQLVELKGGKTAVRMVYAGLDVPLLDAVKVGRPTTLPPFISKSLGHEGPIQLQPGTYRVDEEAGVTIDARLLGR
ncbi:MAG TPA: hypothetical protein VKP65_08190 [Rhodothermales bacterium]|nr:hypothetical protein [Rhodothermales bacterium]